MTFWQLTVKVQSVIDRHRTVVVSVVATNSAFAALLADGSVVCWGHPNHGGGDSAVETTELHGVRHIAACWTAFAAILEDDTFICWGNDMFDGIARPRVKDVQQLHGGGHRGGHCFVCVHGNSSVTLWPPVHV